MQKVFQCQMLVHLSLLPQFSGDVQRHRSDDEDNFTQACPMRLRVARKGRGYGQLGNWEVVRGGGGGGRRGRGGGGRGGGGRGGGGRGGGGRGRRGKEEEGEEGGGGGGGGRGKGEGGKVSSFILLLCLEGRGVMLA